MDPDMLRRLLASEALDHPINRLAGIPESLPNSATGCPYCRLTRQGWMKVYREAFPSLHAFSILPVPSLT